MSRILNKVLIREGIEMLRETEKTLSEIAIDKKLNGFSLTDDEQKAMLQDYKDIIEEIKIELNELLTNR